MAYDDSRSLEFGPFPSSLFSQVLTQLGLQSVLFVGCL